MSRADTWMPFYVGDYIADTGHLRTIEHGAYLLLILHYWRTGPLPDDDAALARVARVSPKEWAGMSSSLRAMFKADGTALRHKRIDAERGRVATISDRRRVAGKAGAAAKHGVANATQMPDNCQTFASDLPKQSHGQLQSHLQEDKKEPTASPTVSLILEPVEPSKPAGPDPFEAWWREYPRKVGKEAARIAYRKVVPRRASHADVLHGLRRQRWPDDAQFIPHPQTWLNGGRWQDDPTAAAPPPPRPQGKPSNLATWLDTAPEPQPSPYINATAEECP